MVLYLDMDGLDDYISVPPSFPWNTVEIDLKLTSAANNSSFISIITSSTYVRNKTGGIDEYSGEFTSVYIDNVKVTNNTDFVPVGQRVKMKVIRSQAGGVPVYVFRDQVTGEVVKGAIYTVTFKYGSTIMAEYDTSTGTVYDQSGNGFDAVNSGGTYKEDTGGGEVSPEETPVSANYSLKQIVTKGITSNYQARQEYYKQILVESQTSQEHYDPQISNISTRQQIIKQMQEDLALRQNIFKVNQSSNDLRQMISKQVANEFMLNQSVSRLVSTNNSLRQVIYEHITEDISTLQQLFDEGIIMVEEYLLKIGIYKTVQNDYGLLQKINSMRTSYSTLQQVTTNNPIISIDTKQIITRAISMDISALQEMYESKTVDADMLQKIISDYKVYKQYIETTAKIVQAIETSAKVKTEINVDAKIIREMRSTIRI
jgi:hypothetical protein